ncbi:Uncharacterised protein [BD1-7 clade bacterium]|nr:Uncharacterised protein [BD1-7 clade bacterium]
MSSLNHPQANAVDHCVYKIRFDGSSRFIDEARLQQAISNNQLSSKLRDVAEAAKPCIVRKNLDWLSARALNHQLFEAGLNTEIQLQFTAEAWQSGVQRRVFVEKPSPIADAGISRTAGAVIACNDAASAASATNVRCSFNTQTLQPGWISTPRRSAACEPMLSSSYQINYKHWSIPRGLSVMLALLLSVSLTQNADYLASLEIDRIFRQILMLLFFVGIALLTSWAVYRQRAVELIADKKQYWLLEETDVWQSNLQLGLYDEELNHQGDVTLEDGGKVAVYESADSSSILRLAIEADDDVLSDLSEAGWGDIVPSFLTDIKDAVQGLLSMRGEQSIVKARISDQNHQVLASLEIDKRLTFQSYNDETLPQQMALVAALMVKK